MDKEVKSPRQTWNNVVLKLNDLKEAWMEHRELMLNNPDFSGEDAELQRCLSFSTNKGDFFTALPRLLDYERKFGAFKVFDSKGSKIEPMEKKP